MAKSDLTAERLRELLHYSPETGVFTWLPRDYSLFANDASAFRWHKRFAGKPAGHHRSDGYYDIRVDDHLHRSHRLAWLYMTGQWPAAYIDHRDRDPSNCQWSNLREATPGQNRQNQKKRKDSLQAHKGIEYHGKRFRVRISVNGRRIISGSFLTLNEAIACRIESERKHFTHSPACEPQSSYPDDLGQPDANGSASQ